MFTPGSRACAYRTASGRAKWPNRDPLGELAGEPEETEFGEESPFETVPIISLYAFGPNSPINGFDRDGEIWGKVIKELLKKFLKPKPPKPPTPRPPQKPPGKPPGKRDPSKPDSKRTCKLIRASPPGSTLNPGCKACWLCTYQCTGTGIVGGGQAIQRYQIGGCVSLTGFVPGFIDSASCEAAAKAGKTDNPYEGLYPGDLDP
jgi:hypothetical protein